MKRLLIWPLCGAVAACFPFDDDGTRDASIAEVRSMLAACHVKANAIEPQDDGSSRLVVTFARQEHGDRRRACLDQQQKAAGASFAEVGGP